MQKTTGTTGTTGKTTGTTKTGKRVLTFRPTHGQQGHHGAAEKLTLFEGSVRVRAACTGTIIGKGGSKIKMIISRYGVKVNGPKRGQTQVFRITGTDQVAVNAAVAAIEEIRDSWVMRDAKHQAYQLQKEKEEKKTQADWARHIQEKSGCEGDDWNTIGSASAWKNKNRYRSDETTDKPRVAKKNRFELPSDSDEEDAEGPTVWAPEAPKGAWGTETPSLSWGDAGVMDITYQAKKEDTGKTCDASTNVSPTKEYVTPSRVTKHTAAKTVLSGPDYSRTTASPRIAEEEAVDEDVECTTSGGGFESAEMDDAGW